MTVATYPVLTEVSQTILRTDEDAARGVYGNCMQAALASALGLELDQVPHFMLFTWWDFALRFWLRGRGWDVQQTTGPEIPQGRAILVGVSPRDPDVRHAVVSEGGAIIWDPHPDRTGLTEVRGAYILERWPTEHSDKRCMLCRTEPA